MSFALAHLKGKIVLASASPRRVEMLRDILGLSPSVVPSTFPEDLTKEGLTPAEYCSATARAKCAEVAQRITSPYVLVVSADSIVVSPDGVIFEKAQDAIEASQMMRLLSGRTHIVITAVCMAKVGDGGVFHEFYETTEVRFVPLLESDISAYVQEEKSWKGKAGAYGIQDAASVFIAGITGDYYNVMGFPISRFVQEVRSAGF